MTTKNISPDQGRCLSHFPMSNRNENIVDKNIKVFSVFEIYGFHFWKVKFLFMASEKVWHRARTGRARSCPQNVQYGKIRIKSTFW